MVAIVESPVLGRLSGDDLRETLPFISVDSAALVDAVVEALSPVIEATGRFPFDPDTVELAMEESTRLVLAHLTTPRRDGTSLSPDELGARASGDDHPPAGVVGRPRRAARSPATSAATVRINRAATGTQSPHRT